MSQSLDRGDSRLDLLLGRVVEEFTRRWGRGESPDIEEYAGRYPEIAQALREIMPALQALQARPDIRTTTGAGDGGKPETAAAPQLSVDRVAHLSPPGYEIQAVLGRGGWASSTRPGKWRWIGSSR